jgi:cystathionine beta-lyase family protein involved in aluminum resistance
MQTVIGYEQPSSGSLKEFGILYDEVPMLNGKVDLEQVGTKIKPATKVVLIQRSRGYSMRSPLTIQEIKEICTYVKQIKKDCICFIDNCYGEFVDVLEPTQVGADIMAGSLIKNPGGGIAPTGGYIVGKDNLVKLASYRLTAPGMGDELGASLANNRLLFQGLFLAPHVVAQAVKGAVFASVLFTKLGYTTLPHPQDARGDIIQAIELGTKERLIAFCQGLQKYSPVDSYVTPEPWDMPGYADQVIMAAGTFVQGASIELSADGPIREPYIVYLQGALTFEHAIIGIMGAAQAIEDLK